MARLPLVVVTLWMAAGVAVGLVRPVPSGDGPLLWLVAAAGAGGAALVAFRPTSSTSRARPGTGAVALLACGGLVLGAVTRRASDRSCLRRMPASVPLQVRGRVVSAQGERLEVRADTVVLNGRGVACRGVVPARWSGAPSGSAAGPTAGPGQPEGPGEPGGRGPPVGRVAVWGRWWSPPGRLPALGRPGALLVDSLARVPGPTGAEGAAPGRSVGAAGAAGVSGVSAVAGRVREAARRQVDRLFGPQAPLAASLLLAQRDALDRDVRDRYARAGLSHLLAISGLHVGLVAGILVMFASALRLGPTARPVVAGAGTLIYVAFLGAPASAVRAALQIVLLLAARRLQRPTRTAALMATAALVLLVADPGSLLSPGFQLSFAGVAGILVMRRPLLERMAPLARASVGGFGAGRWVADGLATSAAATVATAPVVAWHFGRLAPIGVVANLAAIPLLGLALPSLAAAFFSGLAWPAAGSFLAGPGRALLALLDRVAEVAAGVPWGTAPLRGPTALLLTAAVAVGWAVARRAGRVRSGVRTAVWCGVSSAVLLVAPLRPGGDRVELHMIDVGQGDAIAIRTPAARWILVDAGFAGRDYDAGERRVVPYLAARGVRRLEGLVVTHPDADHSGGARAVLRSLRPRWAGDPGLVVGRGLYLSLLEGAAEAGVPWVGLEQGVVLELDGVTLECFAPERVGLRVEDPNDASVVVRVAYGEFSALLMGDAPAEVERRLVDRYGRRLEAEVLKVGHHGSRTSTTDRLLGATGARFALVSVGRGNRYGHPHADVIRRLTERGVQVLRTDRAGSVVVLSDREGRVEVRTERGETS